MEPRGAKPAVAASFCIHRGKHVTDRLSPEERSRNMSRIQCRDTTPELRVRSAIHRMGYRFSLYRSDLPGKPDIVLPKHRSVIFVNGCFWHRHPGCRMAYTPKSRKTFWFKKFDENIARDRKVKRELRALGWRVIVVWECETLKNLDGLAQRLDRLLRADVQ